MHPRKPGAGKAGFVNQALKPNTGGLLLHYEKFRVKLPFWINQTKMIWLIVKMKKQLMHYFYHIIIVFLF
jgi:hypothetical protein